jgi:hypothetical protein
MLPSAVFERLHYHLNTNLGRARAHLSSGAPLPFTLLTSSISKLSKKIIQKNIFFEFKKQRFSKNNEENQKTRKKSRDFQSRKNWTTQKKRSKTRKRRIYRILNKVGRIYAGLKSAELTWPEGKLAFVDRVLHVNCQVRVERGT